MWLVVGGGWSETKIKAKLSPAEAGVWAELGKNALYSGQLRFCLQPRAAHALRSDQQGMYYNTNNKNQAKNVFFSQHVHQQRKTPLN